MAPTLPIESSNGNDKAHHSHSSSRIIPPEIWLQIFSHLQPRDLKAVSTTSKQFQILAQPFLFTVLDVSPFFLTFSSEKVVKRGRSYLRYTADRLEQYTKPHIAPAVSHCWISPYPRIENADGRGESVHRKIGNDDNDVDVNPTKIVDEVLKVLPKFSNLTTLTWHCLDIKPEWWNVISNLHVKNLWINSTILRIPPALILTADRPFGANGRIINLRLDHWPWNGHPTDLVSAHEESYSGVDARLLPLILAQNKNGSDNNVRTISVPRDDTAQALIEVLSSPTFFPSASLNVLRIPFHTLTLASFPPALSNCPNLTSLQIFPPHTYYNIHTHIRNKVFSQLSITSNILPNLSEFDGPHDLLSKFVPTPLLTEAVLWGIDVRPALCDPVALVKTLIALASSGRDGNIIKRMKLLVSHTTPSLLQTLSMFPTLEHIKIDSVDEVDDDDDDDDDEMIEEDGEQLREGAQSSCERGGTSAPNSASFANSKSLFTFLQTADFPKDIRHLKLTTRLKAVTLNDSGEMVDWDWADNDGYGEEEKGASHGRRETILTPPFLTIREDVVYALQNLAIQYEKLSSVEVTYGTTWSGQCFVRWDRNNANSNNRVRDIDIGLSAARSSYDYDEQEDVTQEREGIQVYEACLPLGTMKVVVQESFLARGVARARVTSHVNISSEVGAEASGINLEPLEFGQGSYYFDKGGLFFGPVWEALKELVGRYMLLTF